MKSKAYRNLGRLNRNRYKTSRRDRNILESLRADPCAEIISTKVKKTTITQEILLYIPPISLLLQMTWTYGISGHGGLETMHLDGGFLQAILDEEGGDLGALVSLELDDLAHLLIIDKSTIASKFLLEGL